MNNYTNEGFVKIWHNAAGCVQSAQEQLLLSYNEMM